MSRADLIELEGRVVDINYSIYTVEVDLPGKEKKDDELPKHLVNCHLNGKLRMNNIRILVGDKVTIKVSPYDLTVGTITYRQR